MRWVLVRVEDSPMYETCFHTWPRMTTSESRLQPGLSFVKNFAGLPMSSCWYWISPRSSGFGLNSRNWRAWFSGLALMYFSRRGILLFENLRCRKYCCLGIQSIHRAITSGISDAVMSTGLGRILTSDRLLPRGRFTGPMSRLLRAKPLPRN